MVQTAREVSEAEAEGKTKSLYEDIKATLRVPAVGPAFRLLAADSDYLQMAWRALKPNAQTLFFERCADDLRRRGVELASSVTQRPLAAAPEAVGRVVDVCHYGEPKQFLAVAALRSATNGQQPMLAILPREDKRQLAPGVPSQAQEACGAASEATDPTLDRLKSALGLPLLGAEYGALSGWPNFLETAWNAWSPSMHRREHRQYRQSLNRAAGEAVSSFPFRMDISPHSLRHAGLSERQIDDVRSILDTFYRVLPELVAFAAFLAVSVHGKAQALESPFAARAM
jgi:hypothetical protein